jgi:hypothetical protein
MKRTLFAVCILAAAIGVPLMASPGTASSDPAGHAWQLNAGLNFMPGLVYNRKWEPGYSGSAMTVTLTYKEKNFVFGAGLEAGYGYTGFTVLFPLKGGVRIAGNDHLALYAAAAILPGMILARPAPWFLFAADLSSELTSSLTPDFGLTLSAGPRYTISPGYSKAVAPLEMLDIRIGVAAAFGF